VKKKHSTDALDQNDSGIGLDWLVKTPWKLSIVTGWWLTYPSEKRWTSSVGMMTFPIYMEKKSCSKPKQNRFPNVEPDPVSVVQFLDLLKGTIENYSSG
jgi:hypothetical protein